MNHVLKQATDWKGKSLTEIVELIQNEPHRDKTGLFAYAKTKAQISFAVTFREADQRLCFRYTDSTNSLLLKSKISSF